MRARAAWFSLRSWTASRAFGSRMAFRALALLSAERSLAISARSSSRPKTNMGSAGVVTRYLKSAGNIVTVVCVPEEVVVVVVVGAFR